MPTWPADIPQKPEYGWTTIPDRNIAEFAPEVGPAKRRRRSAIVGSMNAGVFIMTNAELATFKDFFTNTLQDGVLTFTWVNPVTGSTATWRFEGDGYQAEAFFPGSHRVSVSIRRMP